MISTKDKLLRILFILTMDDEFKKRIFEEYHVFYTSIKDCQELRSGNNMDDMINWMINEEEDVIDLIYSELWSYWALDFLEKI